MPYVYLIQPVELIGTNRYKVGMSSLNNLSRMKSYRNGTRYLFICECEDAFQVEKKLIEAFNNLYRCVGGKEYFEAPDELDMVNVFVKIVMGCKNVERNQPDNQPDWMKRFAFNISGDSYQE